jgi:hypothetical protein
MYKYNKQVQYEVRQAAAIQLKNICGECWIERVSYLGVPIPSTETNSDGSTPPLLSNEDKGAVRTKLIDCLLSEPDKSIRDLMGETLHCIALHDFPDHWPELLPTLLHAIALNSDPSQALRVHNALLAMRKVCKRYEYKSREQCGPLNQIVMQSFTLLLPLAQRLSSPTEHSLEGAMFGAAHCKNTTTHTLRVPPPPFHGNYFKSNRRRTGSDTSTTSFTSLSIVSVAARSSWVV